MKVFDCKKNMKKINESINQPLSQQMNESIKSPNFLKHLNFNTKTTFDTTPGPPTDNLLNEIPDRGEQS